MSFRDTLAVLALSLAAALAGTPLFLRAARRWGLLDQPNARSAHARLTPRGGGLVVLVAAAAALAALAPWREASFADWAVLGGAVLMALIGLADDRLRLSVWPKLLLQVAVASAVVWTVHGLTRVPLPPPLGVPLGGLGAPVAVVWLVAVVNFYNFLDGIDGLAAVQGLVTGLGIALAGWDPLASAAGAALAGACLGFLFFNWAPARVFLGDAGSALLGFSFGALPLMAPRPACPSTVFVVAVSLWLFLADATYTIARRWARGEDLLAAHRQHVYQRLVETGLGHADVALALGLGSAVLTAMVVAAWRMGSVPLAWLSVLAGLGLFGLELAVLRRRAGGGAVRPTPAVPGGQEARVG